MRMKKQKNKYADVVEQVDTRDLKSLDLIVVEVRVLSSAPINSMEVNQNDNRGFKKYGIFRDVS